MSIRKNDILSTLFCFILMMFFHCSGNLSKGQIQYEAHCAGCHGSDGAGFKNLYPPITPQSNINTLIEELPCIIKNGIYDNHPLNTDDYQLPMLANPDLNDVDITNIRNYVVSTFLVNDDYISLKKVKEQLQSCHEY